MHQQASLMVVGQFCQGAKQLVGQVLKGRGQEEECLSYRWLLVRYSTKNDAGQPQCTACMHEYLGKAN